jgi:hypothetical protein
MIHTKAGWQDFTKRNHFPNQTFINHLNTAHAGNLQVRVRGNAAACGAVGVLRDGGTILTVYRDSFS